MTKMRKRLQRPVDILEAALVMADLNPIISEPIRFGSLFAGESVFHNAILAGLAFGTVTLILDAGGTVAVVDLLEKRLTEKIINTTNELVRKARLAKLLDIETSFTTDFSITLLVGTPITLVLKQRQDPKRGRKENMGLGLTLSALASVVSAVQGGAIVAGLWHPSTFTIALAVLAIASLLALQRWLRKKFS